MPDNTPNPDNPSGLLARSLGCQMVAMRYQLPDSLLKEDTNFFDQHGHAFVLKPEELRYVPVFIEEPKNHPKTCLMPPATCPLRTDCTTSTFKFFLHII